MKTHLKSLFYILICLCVLHGCGQKRVSDTAASVHENPTDETVMMYMATLAGLCSAGLAETMASDFDLLRINNFVEDPEESLAQMTQFLTTLQLGAPVRCEIDQCIDFAWYSLQYPDLFEQFVNKLLPYQVWADQSQIGGLTNSLDESLKTDIYLQQYTVSRRIGLISKPDPDYPNRLPPVSIFPTDFGNSPYDLPEMARTILEYGNAKCPISFGSTADLALKKVEQMESRMGASMPPQYASYSSRLQYFGNSQLLQQMANKPDYMPAMLVPGYSQLYLYSLLQNRRAYPELFVLMHVHFPEVAAQWYRHIRNRQIVQVPGIDNYNKINDFITKAYVPGDFGDDIYDMPMLALFYLSSMNISPKNDEAFQISQKIQLQIKFYQTIAPIPAKYASPQAAQQYFNQFHILDVI